MRDTCAGAPSGCTPSVTTASIGFNSNPADGDSISPSISADGRYVVFVSSATNLVVSDTNGVADVFVRDTCAGVASGCSPSTQRVSVATDGTQANGASTSATIDAAGRYITFESEATNLGTVSSSASGIFLRDTCAGAGSACTPSTQPLEVGQASASAISQNRLGKIQTLSFRAKRGISHACSGPEIPRFARNDKLFSEARKVCAIKNRMFSIRQKEQTIRGEFDRPGLR